jgi:predicted transcriptional regulator
MLEHGELLILTTRIVTSYLGGNRVAADQVSDLIETVAASLVSVHQHGQITEPTPIPTPAVPIRKSVTPDSIICLECGQKMKMLRRHLATDHGMSVDNYRAKWDLPAEYPMVAPVTLRPDPSWPSSLAWDGRVGGERRNLRSSRRSNGSRSSLRSGRVGQPSLHSGSVTECDPLASPAYDERSDVLVLSDKLMGTVYEEFANRPSGFPRIHPHDRASKQALDWYRQPAGL